MYKLVLILIVLFATHTNINANPSEKPSDINEISQWEYWNAFSQNFNKTGNYWEAESAALEAEETAENRTGLQEWLELNKEENTNSCSTTLQNI
jgi:hypothetical protein